MRFLLWLWVTLLSAGAFASEVQWTTLARKVGLSEENRASVVNDLRELPDLHTRLEQALLTEDRPFALEVISDLELTSFVPRLLALVASDRDGFLTLAVNSLMDESNRLRILKVYSELLMDLHPRSVGSIVAMLEPLGRLGTHLPRARLFALQEHTSPEVREALLYYLRLMSLRHGEQGDDAIIETLEHDPSRQIREHARAIAAELRKARLVVVK